MDTFLANPIWDILKWLPSAILRRVFSKEWMAEHVYIDLRPRNNAVHISHPSDARVRIYLDVRNDTHADIEIDRVVAKFFYGMEMATIVYLKREVLKPHESKQLFLEELIEQSRADQLPYQYQHNSSHCRLELFAECSSKLYRFRVERTLEGIKPEFLNEEVLRGNV